MSTPSPPIHSAIDPMCSHIAETASPWSAAPAACPVSAIGTSATSAMTAPQMAPVGVVIPTQNIASTATMSVATR